MSNLERATKKGQEEMTDEAMEAHVSWIRRSLDEMRSENLQNFSRISDALEAHKKDNEAAHKRISAIVAATTEDVRQAKTTVRVLRAVALGLGTLFLTACSAFTWVYSQLKGGL